MSKENEKEMSDYLEANFSFDPFQACCHDLLKLYEFIFSGAWRKYAIQNVTG